MKLFSVVLAAAGIAALCGTGGLAAPSKPYLDPVKAFIDGLDILLDHQEIAVHKATKAYLKASDGLADDLNIAVSMAKPLEKAFKDDADLETHFGGAIASFTLDIETERAKLDEELARAPDGKKKNSAQKARTKGDGLLNGVSTQLTYTKKLTLLKAAYKQIAKGLKLLSNNPFFLADIDGVPFEATFGSGAAYIQVSNHFNVYGQSKADEDGNVEYLQVAITGMPNLQEYPIEFAAAVHYKCPSSQFNCIEGQRMGNPGGKVTFTRVDPIKRIVEGFFSYEAQKLNQPQTKVTISDGNFRAKWVVIKK